MTHHVDVERGREIVARWCSLAEQRLEHLTELFETGRWRRYHSELAFLENIHEAKKAVEIWRSLVTREDAIDNTAPQASWIGRGKSARTTLAPLSAGKPSEQISLRQLKPEPVQAVEPRPRDVANNVLIALEDVLADSAKAPPVPEKLGLANLPPPVLDLASIQQRYPLLRNAL
jgi:uncharacterized repeat protein (TIGR03809 family)